MSLWQIQEQNLKISLLLPSVNCILWLFAGVDIGIINIRKGPKTGRARKNFHSAVALHTGYSILLQHLFPSLKSPSRHEIASSTGCLEFWHSSSTLLPWEEIMPWWWSPGSLPSLYLAHTLFTLSLCNHLSLPRLIKLLLS